MCVIIQIRNIFLLLPDDKMYTKLLRKESGLKALESRALRSMSGPKSSGTVQHIFRQWVEKITPEFGGER